MRLLRRDQRTIVIRKRTTMQEPDGTTYEGWDPEGLEFRANVQPAGGRVMAEQYGERLGYMLVAYVEGHPGVKESSGVWVNAALDREPDYRVVAVRQWRQHTILELEKV